MKKILILTVIILLVIILYRWFNKTAEYFTVSDTISITDTTSSNQNTMTALDEIQLVNSIVGNISERYAELVDCEENSIICINDNDKLSIIEAYETSQSQPIEDRLNVFLALTEKFQTRFGDLSNIYWDFKIIDIKFNKTMDDYFYSIIKNFLINSVYNSIKEDINILPSNLISIFPNGVPKDILACIIDRYFTIDIINKSITYIGLGTKNACSSSLSQTYTPVNSESINISSESLDNIIRIPSTRPSYSLLNQETYDIIYYPTSETVNTPTQQINTVVTSVPTVVPIPVSTTISIPTTVPITSSILSQNV